MLIDVKVPILAESVPDATLIDWRKTVGDSVDEGESLIDLETDKVTLEVPAPVSGVLKEIRKQNGETAVSGEVLAVIDTAAVAEVKQQSVEKKITQASNAQVSNARANNDEPAGARPRMSPSVRQFVAEHGLDPTQIAASGKQGRLLKADVTAHLAIVAPKPAQQMPKEAQQAVDAQPPANDTTARPERREGMSRLRRRVAERLLMAQHENAILSTFNEVNMQPVMALRRKYREAFEQQHGVGLGFMSFFTTACIAALRRFPIINASVDGSDIVLHDYYDIGIAVSAPRGLVVPVLRDADRLGFADIEAQIKGFGQRAGDGSLSLEDLSGGTFTITNGGVFGSLLSTPIINPPQSAILGMHKIEERPIAEDGQVVIRPMMYMALSYDHRIIDGRDAVQFLVAVKELLEDPSRMLLGI